LTNLRPILQHAAMAAKKESAPLRGAKLVKRAIESAKAAGIVDAPEAVPASLAKKLQLPNGEKVSAGMKEALAFDNSWFGIEFDEDEGEIEAMSLEELVEEHFGEDAVKAFGEAYDVLSEDFVPFAAETEFPSALYVGTGDEAGEYPVISMSYQDGVARIGGFVPFDIWLAQQWGALEKGKDIGDVPAEYAGLPQAICTECSDGRLVWTPKAGEGFGEDEADDDEDEDEDEA
jgi:hypothetical protein